MPAQHDQGFKNFFKNTFEWIIGGALDVNGRADLADITLADPAGTDRDITVQLKDALGDNLERAESVELLVFADAAGLAFAATGGSTGIVDNGAGDLVPVVAKKVFHARSDATGLLELRWTDTASEVAFLGVRMPSGRVVISGALTI